MLPPSPKTIYLSGPMTGIEDFNRPAFDKAAKELRDLGFEVIVPGENESYDEIEKARKEVSRQKREFYLSRDIEFILEQADLVVVLPGWEESEGAKLEVAVAQAIGIPVFRYRTNALLRGKVALWWSPDWDHHRRPESPLKRYTSAEGAEVSYG